MLHPETQLIAKELIGYEPFTAEEAVEQFQADITYDPAIFNKQDPATYPINGSVFRNKHGKLRCYWKPKYADKQLEGWYDVPTNEEIEEWTFDSICFTPDDDEVEPDHPDSWLSILGMI